MSSEKFTCLTVGYMEVVLVKTINQRFLVPKIMLIVYRIVSSVIYICRIAINKKYIFHNEFYYITFAFLFMNLQLYAYTSIYIYIYIMIA